MIRECTIEDTDFIDMVSKHPENWDKLIDDNTPPSDQFTFKWALDIPEYHFLKAIDEDKGVGYFLCVEEGDSADCHVCFAPNQRKHTKELGKEAIDWMFTNTEVKELTVKIMCDNVGVYKYAKRIGFELIGLHEESFLKNGRWHDQYILQLEKEVV